MTIIEFQKALAEEIEVILKDIITKDADGEKHVGVSVYRQYLPKVTEDDEDVTRYFPYAIVRLRDATTPDDYECWIVDTDIILGVHDDDPDMGGNDNIAIMIERIVMRFSQEARLAPCYTCDRKMDWAMQDEDTYPYYFGGVNLRFYIPKPGRKPL